jgi:PAS domain S-box-containing protein
MASDDHTQQGKVEILIVEDNELQAKLLKHLLVSHGYQVTVAGSGEDALARVEKQAPSLIISDVRMPGMDGFELVAELKRNPKFSIIPVILLTSLTDLEDLIRGLEAGVEYYLTKPYDAPYLLDKIASVISETNVVVAPTRTIDFDITVVGKHRTIKSTPQRFIRLLLSTYQNAAQINRKLLKTQQQLLTLNQELESKVRDRTSHLQHEIEQRAAAEKELQKAHDELDQRVKDRTAELAKANAQLRDEVRQRQAAEEIIRRSEEKYRLLVENAPVGIVFVDRKGNVIEANQSLHEILGSPSVAATKKINIFAAPSLEEAGIPQLFRLAMDEDRMVASEGTYRSLWGKQSFYSIVINPTRLPDGTVYGCQAIVQDISDRKNAERVMLESQRSNALSELGGLVAHNFNNVLQVVIGGSQLALTNLELGNVDDIKNTLQQVLQSAFGGAEIVKRLQYLVRLHPEKERHDKAIDLSLTVHRAIEMSRLWWQTTPEKFGVRIILDRHLGQNCFVRGNSNEYFEVAVNLIRNAAEALPNGGRIEVRTSVTNGEVVFQVQDNGSGIPPESLSRVFEPFWTTKNLPGSGMGLASSRLIVEQNDGHIDIASTLGQGTTVTVTLARATAPAAEIRADSMDELGPRLKILLVDDMEPVLRMLQDGLELNGHEVFAALSGRKALELFKQRPIDVVICDLGMPEMNGWEVGKTIRQYCEQQGVARPPFILITGWSGQPRDAERMKESGVDLLVEKPIEITKLLAQIRSVMNERRREQSSSGHVA